MDEEKGVEKVVEEEKLNKWARFAIIIVVFISVFISVNVIVKSEYPEEELTILVWVKRVGWVYFILYSVAFCDLLRKKDPFFKIEVYLFGTGAILLLYLLLCILTPLVFWVTRQVQEGNEGLSWLWGVIWN